MAEYSQKWHNGTSRGRSETSDGLAAIQAQLNNLGEVQEGDMKKLLCCLEKKHEENSNLIKEIEGFDDVAIRNQGASDQKTLRKFKSGQMSKIIITVKKRGNMDQNSRKLMELHLSTTPYLERKKDPGNRTVKCPKVIAENVLVGIGKFTFPVDFIILDMPEDIKVPLILKRPFLSTARAKINVYKRKITFKRETLVLNISLDPFSEDYIELNDLNEPFELRRNQGDDLMPTIEEGEVIEEFRTRDEDLDTGIDEYPSYYDKDKKIHIDCAHNLKFSCMIGFEFTRANFFPLLYVNVMSRRFHNSIMENKMVYKGDNVVGALMDVHVFVGTFFVMTDFEVLENIDAYRDDGMGDFIFGEPFLREVGIKTKWFEGIITLYNGDVEVETKWVRSHPRFKHHTNEQCNKILPLLKVSEKDERNGISHAYQKLKRFYKGVLNLGPDYI
ncbi:homeodomain-like protein [Tanacetum coccineum]